MLAVEKSGLGGASAQQQGGEGEQSCCHGSRDYKPQTEDVCNVYNSSTSQLNRSLILQKKDKYRILSFLSE